MSELAEIARCNEDLPDELPKQHEVVSGILVRKAMPGFRHADLQRRMSAWLDRFDVSPLLGGTGGGWRFGTECEVELLPGERYLPDLAGWRVERMPQRPGPGRVLTPPQWVCEILSPSTANRDRGPKLATYAAAGVDHVWLLDPDARTLTVLEWGEGGYRKVLTAGPADRVRAEPFDAVELDVARLLGE